MTRDEIVRMAREAGGYATNFNGRWMFYMADIERFATLVAATEREECARVCDAQVDAEYATGKVDHNEMGWTQSCAIAIRARTK